ncbi:hypothetical protein XA68_11693 [Ophiocordyceps unilateralis]|uniref:Alpha 1,4-glycosyltransferase domain-containing protein n=1 Tax=Ophiocordyceps unilateralis TaxID=268505 RepID=A0A2A9PFB7_OPHUN|nr:hypothetical protein XA68_11693 [Ophiocordyceps unilateralis]
MTVSRARRKIRLLFIIVTSFLLINCFGILYIDGSIHDYLLELVRPTWFYVTGLTRYNFRPTTLEQACFNGSATRINAPGLPEAIPRVVHFITGVDRPNPITLITWLAVRAVAANLGPDVEIRLHHVFLSEDGPWWPEVRDRVTLVRHEPSFLDGFSGIKPPPPEWHPAHKADILRLQILSDHGGIYLDADVILLRPLDTLLSGRRDVIMGYEGGHRQGMCNAVILAKKGAPFLQRWYSLYDYFDPSLWNYHSVMLPAKLAAAYPDDICPLSPEAFFWPLWTDDQKAWMHRKLDRDEADEVAAAMERNGGALFPGQLAYHATGSAKHMRNPTPHGILTEDTRFNMLVRRYIDAKKET